MAGLRMLRLVNPKKGRVRRNAWPKYATKANPKKRKRRAPKGKIVKIQTPTGPRFQKDGKFVKAPVKRNARRVKKAVRRVKKTAVRPVQIVVNVPKTASRRRKAKKATTGAKTMAKKRTKKTKKAAARKRAKAMPRTAKGRFKKTKRNAPKKTRQVRRKARKTRKVRRNPQLIGPIQRKRRRTRRPKVTAKVRRHGKKRVTITVKANRRRRAGTLTGTSVLSVAKKGAILWAGMTGVKIVSKLVGDALSQVTALQGLPAQLTSVLPSGLAFLGTLLLPKVVKGQGELIGLIQAGAAVAVIDTVVTQVVAPMLPDSVRQYLPVGGLGATVHVPQAGWVTEPVAEYTDYDNRLADYTDSDNRYDGVGEFGAEDLACIQTGGAGGSFAKTSFGW